MLSPVPCIQAGSLPTPHHHPPTALCRFRPCCPADTTPAVEGFLIHIVHLSDADMLQELAAAKAAGLPLSVETCPHYLEFAAEDVEEGDVRCVRVGGWVEERWCWVVRAGGVELVWHYGKAARQ